MACGPFPCTVGTGAKRSWRNVGGFAPNVAVIKIQVIANVDQSLAADDAFECRLRYSDPPAEVYIQLETPTC